MEIWVTGKEDSRSHWCHLPNISIRFLFAGKQWDFTPGSAVVE